VRGEIARVAANALVVPRGAILPADGDLVVASDAATASDLAAVYPSAVRVFVVHSTEPCVGGGMLSRNKVQAACLTVNREPLAVSEPRAVVVAPLHGIHLAAVDGRREELLGLDGLGVENDGAHAARRRASSDGIRCGTTRTPSSMHEPRATSSGSAVSILTTNPSF